MAALRRTILQLAVQGRLTTDWRRQHPNVEPAGVLLERIKEEKARLVKEGKIKAQKPLPPIREEEIPFEVPQGWEWTCLYSLGTINPRNAIDDNLEVSFVPMSSISEIYGKPVEPEDRLWNEIKSGYTHVAERDVCIAKITPCFENGKSCVMTGLRNGYGAGTTELHVFRKIHQDINEWYIYLYLRNPGFSEIGKSHMTGTAGQKRVTKDFFSLNPLPLPPLAEQQEIVTRVEQLLTLCDRLEDSLENTGQTGANTWKAIGA